MTFNDCFELGYITKSHGLDGDVTAVLDTDNPKHYSSLKSLFLEIKGALVPYMVGKIRVSSGKAIISLQGVSNSEQAEALKGSKLWLPLSALPKIKGSGYYFHELIGFTVTDKTFGTLGPVESIFNLPHQDLIAMRYKGSEVLIPINDHIVQGINRPKQEVYTQLPEGLLEVYLEHETGEEKDLDPDDADDLDEPSDED